MSNKTYRVILYLLEAVTVLMILVTAQMAGPWMLFLGPFIFITWLLFLNIKLWGKDS